MENLTNLEIGLRLLFVGMITVFTILLIVVLISRALIYFTNKLTLQNEQSLPQKSGSSLEGEKIAILTAVVNAVTQGKGKIEKIKKL